MTGTVGRLALAVINSGIPSILCAVMSAFFAGSAWMGDGKYFAANLICCLVNLAFGLYWLLRR